MSEGNLDQIIELVREIKGTDASVPKVEDVGLYELGLRDQVRGYLKLVHITMASQLWAYRDSGKLSNVRGLGQQSLAEIDQALDRWAAGQIPTGSP